MTPQQTIDKLVDEYNSFEYRANIESNRVRLRELKNRINNYHKLYPDLIVKPMNVYDVDLDLDLERRN